MYYWLFLLARNNTLPAYLPLYTLAINAFIDPVNQNGLNVRVCTHTANAYIIYSPEANNYAVRSCVPNRVCAR